MLRRFKQCVFCGKPGKLSNEHLWPDWLNKIFPDRANYNHHFVRVGSDATYRAGAMSRPGDPASQRMELVCEACNNGWMSRIQSAAKPHLIPLMTGYWRLLDEPGRLAVANWITLISMVREFELPPTQTTTAEQRRAFMQDGHPGAKWLIGIAPYWGLYWHKRANHSGFGVATEPRPKMRVLTAGIGSLMFHCASASKDDEASVLQRDYAKLLPLDTLWPHRDASRLDPSPLGDIAVFQLSNLLRHRIQDLLNGGVSVHVIRGKLPPARDHRSSAG